MKKYLYKADNRGFSNHGWLKSYHMFSFANYYDDTRINFGNLRVLNDEFVDPEGRFGPNTHDNMEMIFIPLEGQIIYQDANGNEQTSSKGDIQIISAGKGITHSEYNPSKKNLLNFLQIWIYPSRADTKPRFQRKRFKLNNNTLTNLIRPDGLYGCLSIYQETYVCYGNFSESQHLKYCRISRENGIFLFLITGRLQTEGHELHNRDGLALEDLDELNIDILENSEFLIIEIPLATRFN
jgi:redox-sensitive bicupin YhaK (pirin superfamily)